MCGLGMKREFKEQISTDPTFSDPTNNLHEWLALQSVGVHEIRLIMYVRSTICKCGMENVHHFQMWMQTCATFRKPRGYIWKAKCSTMVNHCAPL